MSLQRHKRTGRALTQAQIAYNELRRAITSGMLPGGAHIIQSEWADRLDVSITPIREAIRRLEQDGLAESEAHKGTTVTSLSLDDAEEIFRLRVVINELQLRKNNCLAEDDLRKARELCTEMDDTRDGIEFADLYQAFHCMVLGPDSSRMSRISQNLVLAAGPYVTVLFLAKPELMKTANEQNYEILEAAEHQAVEEMVALNAKHLQCCLSALRSVNIDELLAGS